MILKGEGMGDVTVLSEGMGIAVGEGMGDVTVVSGLVLQ